MSNWGKYNNTDEHIFLFLIIFWSRFTSGTDFRCCTFRVNEVDGVEVSFGLRQETSSCKHGPFILLQKPEILTTEVSM